MVSVYQNYQRGEQVNYNGHDATVVSNNWSAGTITIEVDGQRITVNSDDLRKKPLFDMRNNTEYYDKQITSLDKSIEKKQEQIKENKTLWSLAVAKIHDCRAQMRSILSQQGVSSFNQITDEKAKTQYLLAMTDKSSAKTMRNRASAGIISAAHSAVSDILSKGRLETEQQVFSQLV